MSCALAPKNAGDRQACFFQFPKPRPEERRTEDVTQRRSVL